MNACGQHCRQYDATIDTFDPMINRLNLPKPMGEAIRKQWGFTLEPGCHLLETRDPLFKEGVLVVSGWCLPAAGKAPRGRL